MLDTQMMTNQPKSKPNYFLSMLSMRCPRCRRGKLFKHFSAYNFKHTLDMNQHCSVCKQHTDMEPGFWYGTGYVSYALSVAVSVASFIAWWVFVGISAQDNRVLWWLLFNGILLLLLQPWLMRLSRTIYLYFFISYDPDYEIHPVKKFDY